MVYFQLSRFKESGSMAEKKRSGRLKTVRTSTVLAFQRVYLSIQKYEQENINLRFILISQTPFFSCNIKSQEIHELSPDILGRVMENTVKRMHCCFHNNGAHLKDMLFSNKKHLEFFFFSHEIKLSNHFFHTIFSLFFLY